jgi:hypothetical protein
LFGPSKQINKSSFRWFQNKYVLSSSFGLYIEVLNVGESEKLLGTF